MPASDPVTSRPPLPAAIIAGTVALIESAGPLEDQSELVRAHGAQATRSAQFMERAWLLGERLGLPDDLSRWRSTIHLVVAALAVLVALSALGMSRAVVGESRSINAIAALVTLLGLHFLTLGLWLLSVLWPGAMSGLSLGRLALWLGARMPGERSPHALTVVRATNRLLQERRLLPWAFGLISHTIWALAFVLILAVLAFGFSFHSYQLSWETTILSSEFFQRFVQIAGWLPSLIGFPVPDPVAVQHAGAQGLTALTGADVQRDWAWWLMGCVFTYGLLPRVGFALLSYLRWSAGVANMGQPDSGDPYVRGIFARLEALDPPLVTDEERRSTHPAHTLPPRGPGIPGTLAVIGFELPPELPWPLQSLPVGIEGTTVLELRLAGAAAERQNAIQALGQIRPWTLLLVCHGASSPDRGTARFLRETSHRVEKSRILLVEAEESNRLSNSASGLRRWSDWLKAEKLDAIELVAFPEVGQENA
ncbi:DUF2868 domain-containing protein [Ottowia thiooxydans]|uniref:DUF2868 domain-containing protein n=1 Tax=Ottowia thiooxydans TaxID=219182 RepID=A0ABV2Q509_9BURK